MIKFKIINLHELSRGICSKYRSRLPEMCLSKTSPKIYNNFIREQTRPEVI